jgi:hypothetical protein
MAYRWTYVLVLVVGLVAAVLIASLGEPVGGSRKVAPGVSVPVEVAPSRTTRLHGGALKSAPLPSVPRASSESCEERLPLAGIRQLPEPSDEAVATLERVSEAEDRVGLRALIDRDRSVVRYEAVRRFLALGAGLNELRDLFDDDDANLHGLLGSAYGAGGTATDAHELGSRLRGLDAPSARLAAAGAVLEIDARDPVGEVTRSVALEALDRLARGADSARAEEACWTLGLGARSALGALRAIASDRGLDPGVRLEAAERVGTVEPAQATGLLEEIAADQRGSPVGRYADALLKRGPVASLVR